MKHEARNTKHETQKSGQAALIAVILMLVIMLSAVFGASSVALKEAKVSNEGRGSRYAFYAAEAGVDDAVYRLKRGKNLTSSFSILLNGATANTIITTSGSTKEIKSTGDLLGVNRAIKATLFNTTGVEFHYGAQVGDGGLVMSPNSEVRGAGGTVGSVYANGPVDGDNNAKITGDLTVAGNNSADDIIVLGTLRANTITDSKICGDAFYQAIDSSSLIFVNNPSSPTCSSPLTSGVANPGSTNSAPSNMPISQNDIQGWKNDACPGGGSGCTITGNCGDSGVSGCNIPNNGTLELGPKKIVGDLVLTKKQTLIVTGTLYFTGHLDMDSSSGATIKCDPSFGGNSCIVIFDGWMHIKNNSVFQGSGTAGSYILILTTLANCNGQEGASGCTHHNAGIDLHNNATGAIFYASDSMVNLHNGVNITELVAYKLSLDNNAIVTYEQGLANANFSSGPSGGWNIESWGAIVP